jgi:hemerythrin-like domain-containing protein
VSSVLRHACASLQGLPETDMTDDAIQILRDEHEALAAMLRSLAMLVDRGPRDDAPRFFEVVRSMLFYVDEFPERRHHPNESKFLFPPLLRDAPELRPVIERLENDHEQGEHRVRELQHLLTAWEMLGETRRDACVCAIHDYVRFYLTHMRVEETELLPAAGRLLSGAERAQLDAVFAAPRDPLAGGARDPAYEALFRRIVLQAPAPIGLGDG